MRRPSWKRPPSIPRGLSEAVVAGVVGSFAYNAAMTLGAAALARPLAIADASSLPLPWIAVLAALASGVLAVLGESIGRTHGIVLLLLSLYPLFIALVLVSI